MVKKTLKTKINYTDLCLDTLTKNRYRVTPTRKLVINSIEKINRPFSIKILQEYIEEYYKKEALDSATLYRIIEVLESLELIHHDKAAGSYIPCKHIACNDLIHVIYSCKSCLTTSELHLSPIIVKEICNFISSKQEFNCKSGILRMSGLCKRCS